MKLEFFMPMVPPTITAQEKKIRVVNGKPKLYDPPELAAAKNKYISDIYEQYKNKLTFYRRMLVHEDNLQSICKKHEQIFYWIAERNEEKARLAMENHVTINLKMIAKNG